MAGRELVGEGQGVVALAGTVSFDAVAEIGNVLATAEPGRALGLRSDHHLHARVVDGPGLAQVDYVELDAQGLTGVSHSEVVPLRVALGVDVVLQH